jgi:cytidine deaminase
MWKSINIEYQVMEKVPVQWEPLAHAVGQSLSNAYAPYSGFKVACSVQNEQGVIFTGNNQENAAYPSGLCAERVAMFYAKSKDPQPISRIMVIAQNQVNEPADAFSCGNCRQVMIEYASIQKQPIELLMRNKAGHYIYLPDVRFLMPFSFQSATLQ